MKVNYAGSVRVELGVDHDVIDEKITDFASLISRIGQISDRHKAFFTRYTAIRAYTEGRVIGPQVALDDFSEITLFSPMSGG